MTRRISALALIVSASALFVATGCKSAEGQGLPPSTGSGAPPPPSIPKLSDLAAEPSATAEAPSAAWTGSLYARHEAELGPKMSGVLSQVTVDEGDHVKKGQLLFSLDSAQASLGVSQAKAAIATAQVAHDAAVRDFARATELFAKGSIAPASYDQAKAANDHTSSALEQAKVALQQAQRSASDTSIYSPIDGVVTAKLKSVGETATMTPPTVVLVVQDVDKLELRAKLPEKALATLHVGSALHMNVPTVSIGRDVTVKRVNPTIEPRTRTVEVVADVDNADGKLKVGMLVEVSLKDATAEAEPSADPKQKLAAERPSETP